MRTFSAAGSAMADPQGRALVTVRGPHRTGTTWVIGYAALQSTGAAGGSPTAKLYRSFVHDSQLLGTSVVADADTMEGLPGDVLSPGDSLVVVFEALAPGTPAFVSLRGNELEVTL